jgi:hypothetical protein
VEIFEDWSDVIRSPSGRHNDSGKGILNTLKAIERIIWKAFEEGVAIVKFSGDKRVGK